MANTHAAHAARPSQATRLISRERCEPVSSSRQARGRTMSRGFTNAPMLVEVSGNTRSFPERARERASDTGEQCGRLWCRGWVTKVFSLCACLFLWKEKVQNCHRHRRYDSRSLKGGLLRHFRFRRHCCLRRQSTDWWSTTGVVIVLGRDRAEVRLQNRIKCIN